MSVCLASAFMMLQSIWAQLRQSDRDFSEQGAFEIVGMHSSH